MTDISPSAPAHLVVVAHMPLASALQACAAHVFPEAPTFVHALDIPPTEPPEHSLQRAQALASAHGIHKCLLLTDVLGATPSNIAQQWAKDTGWPLLTGVNLPMLLRGIAYRHEASAQWAQRALEGGRTGQTLSENVPSEEHK